MQDVSIPTADDLLGEALRWQASGRSVALATVVETWGSAPRPAGSLLVCTGDGHFIGSVSGGCVEVAVIEAAAQVLATGQTQLLSFGVSDEQAWSVGLACGGRIRVFVEPVAGVDREAVLQQVQAARQAGQPVVRAVALDGAAAQCLRPLPVADGSADALATALAAAVPACLVADRASVLVQDGREWLLVPFNPPLQLVVVGAVHISQALCRMARELGYRVTVIDPRTAFARPELFPGVQLLAQWPQEAFAALHVDARTAVVLLTHDPKIDDPALDCVRESAAFYIGALGSTRTQAKRLQRLAESGWRAEQLARIHGPAGLAIGARTPAEIAVSVLAQITQRLRQAPA